MALNDYRGDPRTSARQRRAHQSGKQGPATVSTSLITTTGVTVDASNFLELGYTSGELILVAAGQTIKGITTLAEGEWRRLRFGVGCALVYDAVNFILPGLNTISTQDGDIGVFYSNGGTANAQGQWECVQFSRGGVPPNPGNGVFQADLVAVSNILDNSSGAATYSNGTNNDGFGATLTWAGFITINGVAITDAGDIGLNYLLAGQTATLQNGLYTVTTTSVTGPTVLTRTKGLCTSNQFLGSLVAITSVGTIDYRAMWYCTNSTAPVVGTDGIRFSAAIPAPTADGQIYIGKFNAASSTYWPIPKAMQGDATLASDGTLTLASVITGAGPIGGATTVPIITFDAKGRLTTVTSTTITGVSPVGAALTAAKIWIGNSGNVAAAFALTGVLTLSNAGATAFASSTGSGSTVVLDTSPAITGGSHSDLTLLSLRDTSAATFDLVIAAVSSTAFTGGHTLTLDMVNANATVKLGFNLTLTAAATIGGTHSGTSSGTNTGDQTITLTGPITGTGTGSFATSVATSFALTGQATPTATGGQMVYDTTQATFMFGSGPAATPVNTWAVGMLFSATASVSSTTTAETKSLVGTGVGTMTFPANFAGAGCTLRLRARGVMTWGATAGTITFQIKIGTVVVASTGAQAVPTGQSNKYWELDCDIVFRAVGNSGSVMVQGGLMMQTGSILVGDTFLWPMRGNSADPPAVVTIDTTSGRLVDLQSITSNNLHTVTCNIVTLERMI